MYWHVNKSPGAAPGPCQFRLQYDHTRCWVAWNDPLHYLEISLEPTPVASLTRYKEAMQQSISHQRAREAQQAAAHRDELAERIARALPDDGRDEPIHGLHFIRASSPAERVRAVSRPSLCVIAQGAKEIYLGDDCFRGSSC
jgi:AraC-type transcriptional regulator N-terminus